jgi:hypothetical protein
MQTKLNMNIPQRIKFEKGDILGSQNIADTSEYYVQHCTDEEYDIIPLSEKKKTYLIFPPEFKIHIIYWEAERLFMKKGHEKEINNYMSKQQMNKLYPKKMNESLQQNYPPPSVYRMANEQTDAFMESIFNVSLTKQDLIIYYQAVQCSGNYMLG